MQVADWSDGTGQPIGNEMPLRGGERCSSLWLNDQEEGRGQCPCSIGHGGRGGGGGDGGRGGGDEGGEVGVEEDGGGGVA